MKRLLFSISLALLMHAILLFGDFSRLQLFSAVSPELKTISMTLFAYSPPIQDEGPSTPTKDTPVYEAPDAIEKMEDQLLVPKQEMLPVGESNEPLTEKQPLESPVHNAEVDADEPEEAVQVWRKPKRSLKALTKIIPKDVAQIKSIQAFHPKLEPDYRNIKRVELEQLASKSATSESSKNINQLNNSGTKSATESRATSEATGLASKGDQSIKPTRIMASPLYRINPPPKYPMRARRKGYEGTVILEVLVDENGTVKDLKVIESSGHELLDKSAISSIQKWLFRPGTKDGDPDRMWVRIPVRFKLK